MYEQVTRKPLGKAKLFSKYCGKPIIRFVLAQYDRLDNAVVFVKGGSEASRRSCLSFLFFQHFNCYRRRHWTPHTAALRSQCIRPFYLHRIIIMQQMSFSELTDKPTIRIASLTQGKNFSWRFFFYSRAMLLPKAWHAIFLSLAFHADFYFSWSYFSTSVLSCYFVVAEALDVPFERFGQDAIDSFVAVLQFQWCA